MSTSFLEHNKNSSRMRQPPSKPVPSKPAPSKPSPDPPPTDPADPPAATPAEPTPPAYHRDAILDPDGPLNPSFMNEAIRTLMRALPLDDTAEPPAWAHRRMHSALLGLSALHPRDEIEVMLGVQAMAAYHAAAALWRIGMNHHRPSGDSTRHITTAASAARAFDAMLRALERRQVKPLAIPVGRPAPRRWTPLDPSRFMADIEARCRAVATEPEAEPDPPIDWTPDQLVAADSFIAHARTEQENAGLDIANTDGILPGGGMILPDDPTPAQQAYMGRRLGLMYRREYAENLRNGRQALPKIRPIRPGDLIP